jgi:hypothetical protein
MFPSRPYHPDYAARVIELAGAGRTPALIAVELSVSLEDFAAWAAADRDFTVALADAQTIARAWWEGKAWRAMVTGETFHIGIWSKAMTQLFGRAGHTSRPIEEKPAGQPVIRARVNIPDNGRKRRPDRTAS